MLAVLGDIKKSRAYQEIWAEGFEEGYKKGLEEGRKEGLEFLDDLLAEGLLTSQQHRLKVKQLRQVFSEKGDA